MLEKTSCLIYPDPVSALVVGKTSKYLDPVKVLMLEKASCLSYLDPNPVLVL